MELLPGKKENDGNNTTHASHPSSDEDRERISLDLKAGLHPLKVRFPPFPLRIPFSFLLMCVRVYVSDYRVQAFVLLLSQSRIYSIENWDFYDDDGFLLVLLLVIQANCWRINPICPDFFGSTYLLWIFWLRYWSIYFVMGHFPKIVEKFLEKACFNFTKWAKIVVLILHRLASQSSGQKIKAMAAWMSWYKGLD